MDSVLMIGDDGYIRYLLVKMMRFVFDWCHSTLRSQCPFFSDRNFLCFCYLGSESAYYYWKIDGFVQQMNIIQI